MADIYVSTDDYPTLSALNLAANNQPSDNIIFDVKTDIAGGFLDKFLGGLVITTSNDSKITSELALETYGEVTINSLVTSDIDSSTMFGNLTINDGELLTLTPPTFENTAFRPDGVVPDFSRKLYFNQTIPNFGA
jgi:hypothetical protein